MRFVLEEELAKREAADAQFVDAPASATHNSAIPGTFPSSRASMKKFSGRGDLLALPDFLYTMELQLMLKNDPTERQKIGFVLLHFEGPAAKWGSTWIKSSTSDTTYETFLAALQSHFAAQLDPHRLLNLFDRIAEETSGIERYNDQFNTLLSLMPQNFWTEDGIMATYTRRLTPTTQKLVYLSQPQSLQEAMDAAYNSIALNQRHFSTADTRVLFDGDGDVIMAAAIHPESINAAQSHSAYSKPNSQYQSYSNNNGRSNQNSYQSNVADAPNREQCLAQNLCFYCKRPGHSISKCRTRMNKNARPSKR
ncbi:Retrotransposon Gag protein [Monosporozyma servazzii]